MSETPIVVTNLDRKRLAVVATGEGHDPRDVADLLGELDRAEVVPAEQVAPDVVTMNSRVRLLDLADGSHHEYTLVYPGAADFAAGRISVLAPVGTALLGYRVGDEIAWPVPGGERRLRIEEVLYQPEASGEFHL